MPDTLFNFLIFIIIFELFLIIIFYKIRKNFQWLITQKNDLYPYFSEELLKKYHHTSFNKDLGWLPKKQSKKKEFIKTIGEKSKKKFKYAVYNLDKAGLRRNPKFEKKKKFISTFGDSFVFCRHVNDNETWQHFLSKKTKSNILNFGVNNYGVDQGYLRFKKQFKKKTKFVILGFVPETIIRIHSYWKHYSEYGNILAFKPKFKARGNSIKLLKNQVKNPRELSDEKKLRNILKKINKDDFWFNNKFKKDLLHFPYTISLFKNFEKNLSYIILFCLYFISKNNFFYNLCWKIVLKENFKLVIKSYKKLGLEKLLVSIIEKFSKEAKTMKSRPIVIIFPYQKDLEFFKNNKKIYYENFLNEIKKFVDVIDLTKELSHFRNFDKLFVSNYFGSHLSKKGNYESSKIIYNYFKRKRLI